MTVPKLNSLEICAGAGGQALGLEQAYFDHVAAVELDPSACATLRTNRPEWQPVEMDVRDFHADAYRGIDLLAGGVPCPPFSIAGKQLGRDDERDLFPAALRLVAEAQPTAVMLENVRGFASPKFADYRRTVIKLLTRRGYAVDWRVLNACDFGVPQLRPRFLLVAIKGPAAARFRWPEPIGTPPTVGEHLRALMGARGWGGTSHWVERANGIAPTLVGGSKKHGGADLGPTRAKKAWRELGVDAHGVADSAPGHDFPILGDPKLTVRMAARLQGFPDEWQFEGKKTASYRQVGNAFPPPVAYAVGAAIYAALTNTKIVCPQMPEVFMELDCVAA